MKAYTAAQVAELDRYTIEDLGVDIKQLMEVAGLRSAEYVRSLIEPHQSIAVLAGPGGNGGDAFVCAKWLKLWGYDVVVSLSHDPEQLKLVTQDQLSIWRNFGGEVIDVLEGDQSFDVIIDGLLGYSLRGAPRERIADMINFSNTSSALTIGLDVPSGLDATTGEAYDPCLKADHTIVYGVMKAGLLKESAAGVCGQIELVDIGFPREFPPADDA